MSDFTKALGETALFLAAVYIVPALMMLGHKALAKAVKRARRRRKKARISNPDCWYQIKAITKEWAA
jgi:hypothetical protein